MARTAMQSLRSRAGTEQVEALTRGKSRPRGGLHAQFSRLSEFVSYYEHTTDLPSALHTAPTLYQLNARVVEYHHYMIAFGELSFLIDFFGTQILIL